MHNVYQNQKRNQHYVLIPHFLNTIINQFTQHVSKISKSNLI